MQTEQMQKAINKKCKDMCGMRRHWNDGRCRAGVEVCPLYPYCPIKGDSVPKNTESTLILEDI